MVDKNAIEVLVLLWLLHSKHVQCKSSYDKHPELTIVYTGTGTGHTYLVGDARNR